MFGMKWKMKLVIDDDNFFSTFYRNENLFFFFHLHKNIYQCVFFLWKGNCHSYPLTILLQEDKCGWEKKTTAAMEAITSTLVISGSNKAKANFDILTVLRIILNVTNLLLFGLPYLNQTFLHLDVFQKKPKRRFS